MQSQLPLLSAQLQLLSVSTVPVTAGIQMSLYDVSTEIYKNTKTIIIIIIIMTDLIGTGGGLL